MSILQPVVVKAEPIAQSASSSSGGIFGLLKDPTQREELQLLFERMTNMPWAAHFTQHALRILAKRIAARECEVEPGEDDGMPVSLDALDVAENFHSAESFSPFPRGALVVVDLNRSSAFFHAVTDEHKAQLNDSLQTVFGALMQETGAKLIQKPAGDQYAFFVEYGEDETDNAARLQDFMKKLEAVCISTGLNGRDYDRMGLNPSHYPNNQFTMATGVHECDAGDLQAGVFMGSKGSSHGYTAILGEGMAAAIELQKTAGPGQTRYCSRSDIRRGQAVGDYVVAPRPKEPLLSLLNLGHMNAQLLTLFRTLHHPSSLQPEAKKLGATYVCMKVGDASTVVDYERYAQVAEWVFSVLQQPRFQGFSISKQDFTMLHFEVDECHRFNQELVMNFCNALLSAFHVCGLKASVGISHAEAMLTTRYRDSMAVDRSSSAIVEAVRCAALAPDGQIACGRSALAVWGEQVEYEVQQLKEGPLFYALNEKAGASTLRSKGLEGVGEILEELKAFCFSIPASKEVVYALGAEEPLQGKGPGISALFRQLGREAPDGFQFSHIPNVGNGGYGYIRGLLLTMNLPVEGDDETLMANFDQLLLEGEWNVPRVLVLDTPHLSAEEEEAFSRLVARLAGTSTKILCSHGSHVDGFKAAVPALGKEKALVKERALKELDVGSACRLLMGTRPDLTEEDRDALLVALVKVRERHPDLPFTPRHVLHVYASALNKAGAELLFDSLKLQSVRAGDLGVELREDGISATGRRILGVLAHSHRSQWNLNAFHVFYVQVTRDDLSLSDLEKEVVVLKRKYLKDEPLLLVLKGRYAVPAQELFMPEDSVAFSKALLESADFNEAFEDEDEAFSEWVHLAKTLSAPNERLRALTRFLVQSYLARGLRNEARRIYADYFHKDMRRTGLDAPLLLDAMWLFADGEDPVCWQHAKELAEPLLEDTSLSVSLRLELIWRLYRIAVKEHTDHTNLEVLLKMENVITGLSGRAVGFIPAGEGETVLKNQVLRAFASSGVFYSLKSTPLDRRGPGARDALTLELAADREALESSPVNSSTLGREVSASARRILAGRCKQTYGESNPEAHLLAKELFDQAIREFEGLDGTLREDPRQKRDCTVFSNEADMYLLDGELKAVLGAEPEVKELTRTQTLLRLEGMFSDGMEVYRECCLKGDRLNRRAAATHLGNLLLLDARARMLNPQPGDEARICASIPEVRKYWAHFPAAAVEAQIKEYITPELYSRLAM